MKKIIALVLITFLSTASFSAFACPKGEHPYGGTGPYHKGGWCGP